MKAFLLYRAQDFDLQRGLPWNEAALTQDLELNTLLQAMAQGDKFLSDVARKVLLSSLADPDAILYRQDVLRDCLEQPSVVRDLYGLAVEAIVRERKIWKSTYGADGVLHSAIEVLQLLLEMLTRLRSYAERHAAHFRSDGFTAFFAMLNRDLSDEYLGIVAEYLKQLRFRDGVLISVGLGQGNKGMDYVLLEPRGTRRTWIKRITGRGLSGYFFEIADRDEAGHQALAQLRARGINLVANALAQSTDHILSFFNLLSVELGFYVACLNLHDRLSQKGEPTCFPRPISLGMPALSCRGLYDVCLSLSIEEPAVGNDVDADGKSLVIITGANQGGKSTFLRSIGLAQLMMQAGMFVPAESLRANVCTDLYTHFKREEDATMTSGKLDEELGRMSDIADHLRPRGLALFNESFAATNEREGSEIGRQIVRALLEANVKVFFVTHLYDLAHSLHRQKLDSALFLRVEREADGRRTFKLSESQPRPTSYGEDLYEQIFGGDPASVARSTRT